MADPSITAIDSTGDVILIIPANPKRVPKLWATVNEDGSSSAPEEPKARFRVSSKHLTLASGYFKGRLGAQWAEGKALASQSTTELQLPDVAPAALKILLDIIHGRHRQVPQCVPFDQMVDLARLTDYLDCQEIVEPFGKTWVTALPPIASGSGVTAQTPGWILASLVFRQQGVFVLATRTAQRCGVDNFDAGDLPIPRHFIQAIDSAREEYLAKLIRIMRQRASQLTKGPHTCSSACDATFLGLLMRFDSENGLTIQARKRRPYHGFSPESLCENLNLWKSTVRASMSQSHGNGNACANWTDPLGRKLTQHMLQTDLHGYLLPKLT